MKSQYSLPNHMSALTIACPELLIEYATTCIIKRRNIVRQSINPHIHDLRRISRHRHTPALRSRNRSRDGKVFQSHRNKRQHFIPPKVRHNVQLAALYFLLQNISIRRKSKKVVFFLHKFRFFLVIQAFPINQIFRQFEFFAPDTVESGILFGIHVFSLE